MNGAGPGLMRDRGKLRQRVADDPGPALIADQFAGRHIPLPGADVGSFDNAGQALVLVCQLACPCRHPLFQQFIGLPEGDLLLLQSGGCLPQRVFRGLERRDILGGADGQRDAGRVLDRYDRCHEIAHAGGRGNRNLQDAGFSGLANPGQGRKPLVRLCLWEGIPERPADQVPGG